LDVQNHSSRIAADPVPFPALGWVAVGGVVTALAFPLAPIPGVAPLALWPLAWVGLVPFLARLLTSRSTRTAAGAGLVFGTAWFLVAAVWVFRVFDVLGWILIWLPIAWVVLFALAARWTHRAGFSPALAWPLLWIAVEFARSEWSPIRLDWISVFLDPLRFSWLLLGHSRLDVPVLAQTADLWGGYGLSVAPFLSNLVLATAWVAWRTGRPQPRWLALATLLLILAELGHGFWSLSQRPEETMAIPVGVVQSERASLGVHRHLTEALLKEAPATRVVVWPENSFTPQLEDLPTLQALARNRNIVLVCGCFYPPADHLPPANKAHWIAPTGEIGHYQKHERVPFVEYHLAGTDYPIFPFAIGQSSAPGGVAICYDADFPMHVRILVQAGATWLALPTRDVGLWGGTEHAQHSLLPQLRAIENRRPIVQATTSGVSQIIDDHGIVLASLPYNLVRGPESPYLEGTLSAVICPRTELSLYTQGGYLLAPGTTVLAALLVAVSWLLTTPLRPQL
jgi:apolipoprotein N-acyltransferase